MSQIENFNLTRWSLILLILLLCTFLATAQDFDPRETIDTAFLSWNPSGDQLAISGDGSVNIIDVETQQIIQSFSGTGNYYALPAWSPDGSKIGFGRNGNFEIWSNIRTRPVLEASIPDSAGGHANAWSPDSQIIAMAQGDYINFWDGTTYTLIESYLNDGASGRAWSLDWSNNNSLLLVGSTLTVQILDVATKDSILSFLIEPYINPKGFYINPTARAVWSPSEQQIAIASNDAVRVLNLADYQNEEFIVLGHGSFFYGHEGQVFSVSWHPSGQYLASSGEDSTIRIWDVAIGEQINIIELPDAVVRSVAWSPDGDQLAYGSPDGGTDIILVDSSDILP